MSIRLNKLLAHRGVASRRHCDILIAKGHVRVNGRLVTELGTVVEEGRDRIEVDGRPIGGAQKLVIPARAIMPRVFCGSNLAPALTKICAPMIHCPNRQPQAALAQPVSVSVQ